MKAIRALIPALAACGLVAATEAPAQAVNGATRAAPVSGSGSMTRHWSGGHRGTWSGGHVGGRHWGGHHHHHFWGPRVSWGLYFGLPLAWGPAYYWGWPYYYDYPRTIIYRDVERFPEGEIAPSTEVKPGPGAPSQGPLYMNYCESAKAYYPKVTSCPEGWKFVEPTR